MSSSKSEGSAQASWYTEINQARKGAGYFHQLRGARPLRFKPEDYVLFRSLQRDQSLCLIEEWTRWMSDLRVNRYEHVRRAACGASPLTQEVLDKYYHTRIISDRELDVLQSSSQQHGIADQQLTTSLQERQASKLKHKIDVDDTDVLIEGPTEQRDAPSVITPEDALLLSEVNKRPRHNHGRRSSLTRPHMISIDPTTLHVYKYVLNSANIGRLFKAYQVASIATVDNLDIRVTLENIPRFL
ncbi:hypothetical protein DFQ26_000910, partial [Actinomortierella ambigua]